MCLLNNTHVNIHLLRAPFQLQTAKTKVYLRTSERACERECRAHVSTRAHDTKATDAGQCQPGTSFSQQNLPGPFPVPDP